MMDNMNTFRFNNHKIERWASGHSFEKKQFFNATVEMIEDMYAHAMQTEPAKKELIAYQKELYLSLFKFQESGKYILFNLFIDHLELVVHGEVSVLQVMADYKRCFRVPGKFNEHPELNHTARAFIGMTSHEMFYGALVEGMSKTFINFGYSLGF